MLREWIENQLLFLFFFNHFYSMLYALCYIYTMKGMYMKGVKMCVWLYIYPIYLMVDTNGQ